MEKDDFGDISIVSKIALYFFEESAGRARQVRDTAQRGDGVVLDLRPNFKARDLEFSLESVESGNFCCESRGSVTMIESLLQKGQRGRASSTCQLSESPNRGIIWKRHSSEPLNETHMATSRKDAVLWTESCVRCLSGASEIARLSRGKRARAFRSKESTFSLSLSFSGVDTRARKDRLLLLLLRLLLPQTRSLAGRFLEGKKPAHARARKRAISGKPCFPQKNRVIRVYLFAHDSESFLKKSSQTAFSKNPLPRPRSERFESESEMMRSLALTLSLSLSLSFSRSLSLSLSLSRTH